LNNSIDNTPHITGNVPNKSGDANNPTLGDVYPDYIGRSKKELAKHLFTKMMGVKWCYNKVEAVSTYPVVENFLTDKNIVTDDEFRVLLSRVSEIKRVDNKQ